MKKIIFLTAILFISALFTGCEESDYRDAYVGESVIYFSQSETNLFVKNNSSSIDVKVVATNTTSADRTFEVEIDAESTAADDYTLDSNSITIPANSYEGKISVTGNFDNASEDGTKLILNLKSGVSEVDNMGSSTTVTVNIFKLCESNLAGDYTMTTTFGYHDFLPTFETNSIDVELVAVTENSYEVVGDFTGGLWSDLYATAYGTTSREGVVISDICNQISWDQTAYSDQFDGNITYDGDTSSYVDPDTGKIYVTWKCTAYGEYGTSVYEPKN